MFSLQERRLRGDLIIVYKFLMEDGGRSKEHSARVFSVVPSERTRGNGHIETQEIPFKHQKEKVFTVRLVEYWNCLPREVVESPSLEIFQTQPDKVLSNLL